MTQTKYWKPIKILVTAAALVLAFGLLIFPILSEALLTEEAQEDVLAKAIPFISIFITIILMFVLLIFMVALRFNRQIPYRTYRPVESLIVFGILIGVFFLFQPWELISFRYGFLWLLGSLIAFMLWSHLVPHTARVQVDPPEYANQYWIAVLVLAAAGGVLGDLGYAAYVLVTGILVYILWSHARPNAVISTASFPAFNSSHYILAGVLALVVLGITTGIILNVSQPAEPYGYTQRQWDRGLRDEQKQVIIDEADSTYQSFTIPFAFFMGLIPAGAVFFLARETAASVMPDVSPSSPQVMAASRSS
jgi:hypothetical protein